MERRSVDIREDCPVRSGTVEMSGRVREQSAQLVSNELHFGQKAMLVKNGPGPRACLSDRVRRTNYSSNFVSMEASSYFELS